MDGPDAPQVTPAQVLTGLQAALAYCRAMVALRGELLRSERTALRWTQLSEREFAGAWATATQAQLDAAAWLSRQLARYVEGGGDSRAFGGRPACDQQRGAIVDDCEPKAKSKGAGKQNAFGKTGESADDEPKGKSKGAGDRSGMSDAERQRQEELGDELAERARADHNGGVDDSDRADTHS
jgi:hypothetical protein